ncbi:hypothetical protein SEA_TINALIN_48 [Gordonia phage TinaLin]|uniref:Uncharacterized protein n=1 Tax=Gordonia phage TinaLin TaxID=2797324 RepID=A0A7T7K7Z3_9CAUD|nr:hypothetical protein KDJ60_gp58 [Gordonia phage TinaLin]QQM15136.1 hypothetical protein SEA_TINALIN_48 [Gordonia phage TinaLin]
MKLIAGEQERLNAIADQLEALAELTKDRKPARSYWYAENARQWRKRAGAAGSAKLFEDVPLFDNEQLTGGRA